MEFDVWFLVAVPILFLAGWFFRGVDFRQKARDERRLSADYCRGINLLLNNEPDKAIDTFMQVVKLDVETIELHYALGNLFRRRGEFERAVRIHSHLLNRSDLPVDERSHALCELGEDYMKGGLFDYAEDAFRHLAQDPNYRPRALRNLLKILCTEHEWEAAIEVVRTLEKELGERHASEVAHFCCELAVSAVGAKDFQSARRWLAKALEANRNAPRALMLLGDLENSLGHPSKAISCWRQILECAPDYAALVIARLAKAVDAAEGRNAAREFVLEVLAANPSIDMIEEAGKILVAWDGAEAALGIVSQVVAAHPTMVSFSRLLDLRQTVRPADAEAVTLAGILRRQAGKLARYRCALCGFEARGYQWQCPGCNSWDTYSPKRLEELSRN